MLALLLTSMLNAIFLGGSIPACVCLDLATPMDVDGHPQEGPSGCTLDPANPGILHLGEPLYRLYTIILSERLVHWPEKHMHALRNPPHAGLRPGRSTVHQHFFNMSLLLVNGKL